MSHWRDVRGNRGASFDDMEEGVSRAGSSYSTSEIAEQENDRSLNALDDRVSILKRLTTDIHDEVGSHNRMLDQMGNGMDSARGVISGTMDKFKKVFETRSGRNMITMITSFVVLFLLLYFLTR
ncbi:hypothetical protein O6H91_02G120500 [Diphasiastrum complanatum]|uniref:Uncharacterized protein n=1 Tax=Diphasiastrum complanatum TaxID=34168 RepID=A0ACC2EK53_DIPCM|nr:hypothetical protein O6H91_02G120500 [Diphasiastrum complanatum]